LCATTPSGGKTGPSGSWASINAPLRALALGSSVRQ
jgi:hypothetical protein